MKFLPGVEPISFDHDKHIYSDGDRQLISVTTLIHKYVPEFDPTGEIIARCAARDGVTVEELRAEWDWECEKACIKGRSLHSQMEYWIDHGKIGPGDFQDVVGQFANLGFKGKLRSETIIYSKELGIAGTVDVTDCYGNNELDVIDFKTNKALKKTSFFKRPGGFEKMLPPVRHLMSCNFIHYSIQQELYGILLEEAGYWINDRVILYLNPKTRILEKHPCLPLRKEAEAIIEHYISKGKSNKKALACIPDDFDF